MKIPTDKYFEKYLLFHFGLLILAIVLLTIVCFFLWKQIGLQSSVDDSLQIQIVGLQNQVFKNNSGQSGSTNSSTSDETAGWKAYKNDEYGFEVKYPDNYEIEISGGHGPSAHPEEGGRISIVPKGIIPDINNPYIDIDQVDSTYFAGFDDYISKTFGGRISPIDELSIGNIISKIYKLENTDFFYIFLRNGSSIFNVSSPSKDFLVKLSSTFKFTK